MREIDVVQLEAELRDGVRLVDVRTPLEYAEGHVPGAELIPMGALVGRTHELDRSAPLLLICATGNRSGIVCELLREAGFDAVNVAGGTSAWLQSGRPVESGAR